MNIPYLALISIILLTFSTSLTAQEKWCWSLNPPETGVYVNQCYDLDGEGRFVYHAHTQTEHTVGEGSYYRKGRKLIFVFDTLKSPTAFCVDKQLPGDQITLKPYHLTPENELFFAKIIHQNDTILWHWKNPPINIDYSGGEVLMRNDRDSLLLNPEADSCSAYAIFYRRFVPYKSIISGETVVMKRGLKGYYYRQRGYVINEHPFGFRKKWITFKFKTIPNK